MTSSTSPVDIRPDHLEIVQDILREHVPADVKVWVFGSRAAWTTKDSSDLDLALESESMLSYQLLGALEYAFEDSSLPYTVDVVDLNGIGDSFRQIVESQRVPLAINGDGPTTDKWIQCTVAEACSSIKYGLTASASSRSDGPKFLRITDIVSGQVNWNTVPHVEADEDTIAKYRLYDGDIVITRTGASTGTSALVKNPPPAVFASYLVRLQANPQFDARFLAYYLKSGQFTEYIIGVLGDKSAQPNASASTMTAAPLKAPKSKAEQQAIAHVLGTLDDKIELNRRMNETLEEMARALFKSWFVDFEPVRAKMDGRWRRGESLPGLPAEHYDLFPDRLVPSELGEIPEGWEVKELGELIELAYGKALRAADRKDGPVPVYGSNGQVGWHEVNLVTGPGIIVGRKGNPGVVTWAHVDFFPIDTTFYVVPRDASGGLPFLFFALTGQDLPSVSADSAVPGLNRNLAYMNKQLVPEEQVLYEFNDYVAGLFSRRHRLEYESRELTEQRDALLPGLVDGEVRVGTDTLVD